MIGWISSERIVTSKMFQRLCRKPYRGHSHGCPNYGHKNGCPPQPPLDQVIDFGRLIIIIYNAFDVLAFAKQLSQRHPTWTSRQLCNPRYWQGPARMIQRVEEASVQKLHGPLIIIRSPEAHGVDVSALMESIGVKLSWDWPPTDKVYTVSLAGREIYQPRRKS